jgi:hypothetical protein
LCFYESSPDVTFPLIIAHVTELPSKRKSGEDRIFMGEKQYIQVLPFGSLQKQTAFSSIRSVYFIFKMHSFNYLPSTVLVI